MARGTDIHPLYQRGIRWDQVSDIHFVWVKVSDGGAPYSITSGGVRYIPDTHVAGAKSRQIPVGGYHYAQFNPGPDAQADVLLGEIRRLGATGVTPMLDLEAPFSPDGFARDFGIRFCQRIAAGGFRPAVYMNNAFAKALRPDQWGIPGLVIVIARYGAHPDAAAGRYDVHQYSSSGALPGSAGAVDLDESYTDNHLAAQEADMLKDERDALFAVKDALLAPRPSKVAGSTAAYPLGDYVLFNNANLYNLVTKIVPDLTKLVIASDANDVTAAALAAALAPALLPQLEQGLKDAVGGIADINLTPEQIAALAAATVNAFGTKLTGA